MEDWNFLSSPLAAPPVRKPIEPLANISPELLEKLHNLADYIKFHPEEARAGVRKLSPDAQKPAGDIIKIFCSDKDPKTKHDEIQALKAALPAKVAAEIEDHIQGIKKKLGHYS